MWYSVDKNAVEFYESGQQVTTIDFTKYFLFN
jgi:hypothetical protein